MEKFHFRRLIVFRIDFDVFLPLQAGIGKRFVHKFPDGMGLSRSNDIIVRIVLLENQPHRFDIFGDEAPVPLSFKISEIEEFFLTRFDTGKSTGDFPGNERFATAGDSWLKRIPLLAKIP